MRSVHRCADGAPRQFTERFTAAVSPGTAATILLNAPLRLARAVHHGARPRAPEGYELIHQRGFVLQLDLPRPRDGARALLPERLARPVPARWSSLHVDAINQAIAGIPASRIRLHVCWGTTTAPHARCRWRRSCRCSTARRSARSPCRSPIRGTSTSTQCSAPAAARRHAALARRDRHDDQLRRAPAGRRRSDHLPGRRRDGRPGARDRVHGLWLRHLRRLGDGRGERRVGQAADAGARGASMATARLWG